jgi:hypothetical protein
MQGDPLGIDHGPRYEFTHGTRAKVDRRACAECHTDSYCATCHDSLQKPIHGSTPQELFDFVDNVMSPKHHAIQAARNINQCIACHREESCLRCHSALSRTLPGNRSVNPHPAGFGGRCRALKQANDRACLKCHDTTNPMDPMNTGDCK